MSESSSKPLIRREDEIEYEPLDAAEGMCKGVLVNDEHGAPNVALRRFVLDPEATVPKHTNEIEHEQHVLAGQYVVGIEDEEYTVAAGDTIHIPAGAVHWYRNEGDQQGVFLCAVPTGDDEIQLLTDDAPSN